MTNQKEKFVKVPKQIPDYISDYFKDPKNVCDDYVYIYDRKQKVSAEEFYTLGECAQEQTFILTKRIECNDGFNMSVQASSGHYCTPRITIRTKYDTYYTEFEVGYPSKKDRLLKPYSADCEVYGYVPKEVLNQIIHKHKGLKILSPKLKEDEES